MKAKINITNFRKNSCFFFHIPKYTSFIDDDAPKKYLHPNKKELKKLKKK